VAIEQWGMIREQAEAAYTQEPKARAATLKRLAGSASESDRYVAMLTRQWMTKPHG